MSKLPFQFLKSGVFFTFPSQIDDLFMKTDIGMIRIPNKYFDHTMSWDNDPYMNSTDYILLSDEEISKRIHQPAKIICSECGRRLD